MNPYLPPSINLANRAAIANIKFDQFQRRLKQKEYLEMLKKMGRQDPALERQLKLEEKIESIEGLVHIVSKLTGLH